MPQPLWDASALNKRYYEENGSTTVDAVFSAVPAHQMRITYVGYAETAAILRRKRNQGDLSPAEFTQARILLRDQVLINPDFTLLSVNDADFLDGIALTDRHNINTSDAAILSSYLRYARSQPPGTPPCLLVASYRRLIRAAEAEGLRTLNPELLPPADIPALLAGL